MVDFNGDLFFTSLHCHCHNLHNIYCCVETCGMAVKNNIEAAQNIVTYMNSNQQCMNSNILS